MTDDRPATPAELSLQMGPGGGEPERLLLLGVPRDGFVTIREWSGDDWNAATTRVVDAAELLRWVEAQYKAGRTMTQSMYGVRLWLRGEGTAPMIP